MIGVFDLIGTIGSGLLSDRYDNRWLLAIYYGFRGLALIWLVESNATLGAMSASRYSTAWISSRLFRLR